MPGIHIKWGKMENLETYKLMYLNFFKIADFCIRGGSVMMDENVDSDLIDLLIKRMETKRKYSNLSQDIFGELTNLSGLQPRKKKQRV